MPYLGQTSTSRTFLEMSDVPELDYMEKMEFDADRISSIQMDPVFIALAQQKIKEK